jgi:ACR3 family arsenite efflux pump ArsB
VLVKRDTLERHQVWVYLAAVALGLGVGALWPQAGGTLETMVWPVLVVLLYATFTQVPLTSIRAAFADGRFLSAALTANFVVVPVIVWALIQFAPDDDALRLGLLLVLLVPCTDWFITFSQLGRADSARAIALTPLTLILQLLLLPVYLRLIGGTELTAAFTIQDVWPAFVVILAPLSGAAITEIWAARRPTRQHLRTHLAWWPVPSLAAVIFLVAAAHSGAARDNAHLLPVVIAITAAFLATGLILARILASVVRLPTREGRTLAFTLGTRNSFIVLPIALSLPPGWEIAAVVIVMQSLVELLGMIFYLWFVPRVLFPGRPTPTR